MFEGTGGCVSSSSTKDEVIGLSGSCVTRPFPKGEVIDISRCGDCGEDGGSFKRDDVGGIGSDFRSGSGAPFMKPELSQSLLCVVNLSNRALAGDTSTSFDPLGTCCRGLPYVLRVAGFLTMSGVVGVCGGSVKDEDMSGWDILGRALRVVDLRRSRVGLLDRERLTVVSLLTCECRWYFLPGFAT